MRGRRLPANIDRLIKHFLARRTSVHSYAEEAGYPGCKHPLSNYPSSSLRRGR